MIKPIIQVTVTCVVKRAPLTGTQIFLQNHKILPEALLNLLSHIPCMGLIDANENISLIKKRMERTWEVKGFFSRKWNIFKGY